MVMLKELFSFYMIFFRMSAVTFGGGYAMLPILRREFVDNLKWMDEETIMDYYALSQSLPGLIAVNVSIFIGYRYKGVVGAVVAALGMVSPCILIITAIALFMSGFRDNVYVQNALGGVSICVVALILQAVLGLWKKGVKDKLGIVIFAAVFALNMFTDISPIILVVGCGLVGIIAGSLRKGKGEVK